MASFYDFSFMRTELRSVEAAAHFDRVVGNYLSSLIQQGDGNLLLNLRSYFESISRTYRQGLRGTGSRPDWDNVGNRCTYVYRFFAMHSYMVYHSLQLALADKEHLTRTWKYEPSFRVVCIGGGPGSDVAGMTKFLLDNQMFPTLDRLEFTIFDMFAAWEDTWQAIRQSNPWQFPRINYGHGNLTLPEHCLRTWSRSAISEAFIITFVKFFSTVAAFLRNDPSRGALLHEIFRELKPGALVLYIDNRYASQHTEFQNLARSEGVTELLYVWHGEMRLSSAGSSPVIRSIKQRTGFEPLDRCTVSVMLLRKPLSSNPRPRPVQWWSR